MVGEPGAGVCWAGPDAAAAMAEIRGVRASGAVGSMESARGFFTPEATHAAPIADASDKMNFINNLKSGTDLLNAINKQNASK